MSRLFTCPSCKKRVDLHEIYDVPLDLSGAPEWMCARCKQTASREAWGNSNDGVPAAGYFIYGGPAKNESFRHKFPRALVRGSTFGGTPASLRTPMAPGPHMGASGSHREVAIYHRAERYSLRGRYYEPQGPKASKVALLLSGSGGTAHEYLADVARRYCKRLGVAVLLMDYRGFGASDAKTPSEAGLFVDALAMFKFLTEETCVGGLGWSPKDVIIHGYSLGTGVAAELATRQPHAGGLILQCPFTSAADMARQQGAKLTSGIGAFAASMSKKGTEFDVAGKLPGISKPVMVLIANGDTGMRAHGEAIAEKRLPNVTVAHYDGEHEDPENAFKDGSHKKAYMKDEKLNRYVPLARPQPGAYVQGTTAGKISKWNEKLSTGIGCIGDISAWIAKL